MTTSGDLGWDEQLGKLLREDLGSDVAAFLRALPPGYREVTTAEEAAHDYALAASLTASETGSGSPEAPAPSSSASHVLGVRYRVAVRPPLGDASTFRLRRLGVEAVELTSALPLLESFGLVVVQSLPLLLDLPGGPLHLDDISVRVGSDHEGPAPDAETLDGERLVSAIEAVSSGRADTDPLNRLVISAGLGWRQVTVVRAYLRYWHQITGLSRRQLCAPPVRYPAVVAAIVAYFEARFSPAAAAGPDPAAPYPGATPPMGAAEERKACLDRLAGVTALDEDRVLRGALGLVDATLRTNYYSTFATAERPTLVLKFDSHDIPEIAAPVPMVETFVYGGDVEGIHIRAGLIARGGIRWSERPDDFRTEVLDLALAQVKKNAVIVPTGAKGGFVSRTPLPPVGADAPRPGPDQVRAAYEAFIDGLLDITDNIVDGAVVTPPGVVPYDGPDPYLVIAADKGTSTFSDLANGLAASHRFWLGDAFASGGSHGYDHKAMGITARGAWVSVRRHFRALDVDVATDPIRVVGVGDMSGDVFGNGMLQSRAVRLLAAFDHRHIFIDPDPDPDAAFEERSRLAAVGRSSWDDYDRDVISTGGGVWPRTVKSIPLSPQARRAIGIDAAEASPPQLVSAILSAPVDLLWFGGIGTFVKASGEADVEVADHANDTLRVTADQVRARVIAEGANLAITQRARIQYSRRGGRINADFIDNAAGVATSDREVNLKILLALAIERGRIAACDRDGFLARAEAQVATEVLRQVDHSVATLNRAAATSAADLDAYEALVDGLEERGAFDRSVEVLPTREELHRRREAGAGLIRPELATILTYAKSDVVEALETSPLSTSDALVDSAISYFPPEMDEAFGDLISEHRLIRQLVATDVAGELVDNMGIVWGHDLAAELGRPLHEVAAAFWVARGLTGAGRLWEQLERPGPLDADAEAALHAEVVTAVASLTRAYLIGADRFDPAAILARDIEVTVPESIPVEYPEQWKQLGVDAATAERFCSAGRLVEALRAAEVARRAGSSVADAVDVLRALRELPAVGTVGAIADAVARGEIRSGTPPSRLVVWQARAILDDLAQWSAGVAGDLLRKFGPGRPPAAAVVATWSESRRDNLARVAELVSPTVPSVTGPDALAAAALALRRLPGAD